MSQWATPGVVLAGTPARDCLRTYGEQHRKAAEQGDPEAQNTLGNLYYSGARGVPQDYTVAYAWYDIAATQGYVAAKYNRDLLAKKLDAASLTKAQKLSEEYFKRYVEPFQ